MVLWFALWILFTIATRKFHPTVVVAASATGCLELASASVVYLNELLLVPKLLAVRRFFAYAAALFWSIAGITIAVVVLIQFLYDLLWGPNVRRFGFWTNIESDLVWIAVHVVFAACVRSAWRRWAERRQPEG